MSNSVIIWLNKKTTEEIKNLLENCHLYQHVNIDPTKFVDGLVEKETRPGPRSTLLAWIRNDLPNQRFIFGSEGTSLVPRNEPPTPVLTIQPVNVSLYCSQCKRREAFAPQWYHEESNEKTVASFIGIPTKIPVSNGSQLFFMTYQCQRCFGRLVGLIIRREGWKLYLHGRSPMEIVEIPNYIPSVESPLYRDAVIAFNSGKILAALFYLRTFVEQFARRMTGKEGRVTGDEILDAYYGLLPNDQRGSMPSLREWYDKLSVAIHSAKEDAELFNAAKPAIEKHFKIRNVFDMPEFSPAK